MKFKLYKEPTILIASLILSVLAIGYILITPTPSTKATVDNKIPLPLQLNMNQTTTNTTSNTDTSETENSESPSTDNKKQDKTQSLPENITPTQPTTNPLPGLNIGGTK